ncbi:MAG: GntR family transcriptional regulator [Oscillospiraceae bacterium]|nr:GntR family transcriptional regulator [Oscillospiraceae bacterium]
MNGNVTEERKPAYVLVYDRLRAMLTDGMTFPVGSRLPSEPKLAEMLGTSRMTLRQALALLVEDGLVCKAQGRGNFAAERGVAATSSLDKIGHPVYRCCLDTIDSTEMDFRLEPPNEFQLEIFNRDTQVAVVVDRWYRSGANIVAYTLSLMPIETITYLGIDLKNPDSLLSMLESGVYSVADRAQITARLTYVGDFISEKYVLSDKKDLMLITENIFCGENYAPLCVNKHYILPQNCSIEISAVK